MTDFSLKVLNWYDIHGRKNLAWQHILRHIACSSQRTVIPYSESFTTLPPVEKARLVETVCQKTRDSLAYSTVESLVEKRDH